MLYNENIKKMKKEGKNMYNRIANQLAKILVSFVDNDMDCKYKNIDVATYGIELLISSAVNLIFVMLVVGHFFGTFATFVFVLSFCPIRQFAGGFHVRSHMKCTVGFLILFLLFGKGMTLIGNRIVNFGLWIMFGGIILCVSPIDTENKRLDQKLKRICKKRLLCSYV